MLSHRFTKQQGKKPYYVIFNNLTGELIISLRMKLPHSKFQLPLCWRASVCSGGAAWLSNTHTHTQAQLRNIFSVRPGVLSGWTRPALQILQREFCARLAAILTGCSGDGASIHFLWNTEIWKIALEKVIELRLGNSMELTLAYINTPDARLIEF